ncbi:MAG TPA: nucleotidyl transferase AbiEii/AbiGii toxin family protein [Phycisphaerales bacterium]|nr:nucleotidyl transferase AbiEii/AbiGii toxin family protein [Phycisphaerales bacterium]
MSKDRPKNVAASVRQKLLTLAHERKEDFQLILIRYGMERLLHRLDESAHKNRFVLKGAMLFQVWSGQSHRATLDLDLHGTGESSVAGIVAVFKEVCLLAVADDGLIFDADSVAGEEIREDQEYKGVRIRIDARLGVAKIPVQVDIGFSDAITPKPSRLQYPSLIGLPTPSIRVYPKETVVAEKYQAMVALGIANSRMKDFFDIWVLARQADFDGPVLANAITATFKRRRTALPVGKPLALTDNFARDAAKQTQWRAFLRKGRLTIAADGLEAVIAVLDEFLMPPTTALVEGKEFNRRWPANGPWQERRL